MKAPVTRPAKTPETSEFEIAIRQRGAKSQAATPGARPKRENTFSQSRDTREDRSARQMKNQKSSQTFSHGR